MKAAREKTDIDSKSSPAQASDMNLHAVQNGGRIRKKFNHHTNGGKMRMIRF